MNDDKKQPGVNDILTAIKGMAETAKSQQVQIDSIIAARANGRQDNVPAGFGADAGFGEDAVPVKDSGMRTNPHDYGTRENAELELGKLWFDTPKDKLPELTETPLMLVTCTSFVEAMDEFIDNMNTENYEPLDKIFIRRRDRRMKSAGRKSGMELLAFSQIQREKKDLEAGQEMGF